VTAAHEERYAMEMISNAAKMLDARMEIQQKLDDGGFHAEKIILHLPPPVVHGITVEI